MPPILGADFPKISLDVSQHGLTQNGGIWMTEESKLVSQKVLDFYKLHSVKYRLSVLKVFVDFLSRTSSDLNKPKRIIEEFYSYGDNSYDDLYDRFYKKIENIKARKTKGIDDPDLFFLIEKFVICNASEALLKTQFYETIHMLGNSLYLFLNKQGLLNKNPAKIRYSAQGTPLERHRKSDIRLDHINNNIIYEIDYSPIFREGRGDERIKGSEKIKYYLAIDYIKYKYFGSAIVFEDSEDLKIYYGVYMVGSNFLFLKKWESSEPLCMSVDKVGEELMGFEGLFKIQTNMLFSKAGISGIKNLSDENSSNLSAYGFLKKIDKSKHSQPVFDRSEEIFGLFLGD